MHNVKIIKITHNPPKQRERFIIQWFIISPYYTYIQTYNSAYVDFENCIVSTYCLNHMKLLSFKKYKC